jgi:hypothetical protein
MFPTFAIPAEARLGGHIFSPARGFVFLRTDLIIIVGQLRHIQIKKSGNAGTAVFRDP